MQDTRASIDVAKKPRRLAGGPEVRYDKLILSPGVDLISKASRACRQAHADGRSCRPGRRHETVALLNQIEAMRDGGVYAITIPEAPYRCPPGPYERASVIASYFKQAKPRPRS